MATVTLEIISSMRDALANDYRRTFDSSGGTIGRAWDNDFVLPDPMCHISSKHARILFEDGCFYLEDVSTNGIVINETRPLGKGNRIDLSTVERIRVGDYLLAVVLSDSSSLLNSQTEVDSALGDDFSIRNAFQFDLPSRIPDMGSLPQGADDLDIAEDDFLNHASDDMLRQPPPVINPLDNLHEGVPSMDDAFFAGNPAAKDDPAFVMESNPIAEDKSFIPENWNLTGIHHLGTLKDLAASVSDTSTAALSLPLETQPLKEELDKPAAATLPRNTTRLAGGQAEAALRRADIDPGLLDDAEFLDQWIAMLPIIFGGLIELLQSRATIKNEIRANKTMLKPVENNPLKFSINAADAVHNLFVNRRAGFLPADEAVKEAIVDLKLHQIALIDGVQGGINALVNKLSPQAIEYMAAQRPVKKGLFGKVTGSSLWEAYKYTYLDMIEHSTDSFLDVFADDFVQAYEKHIMMAKKAKK